MRPRVSTLYHNCLDPSPFANSLVFGSLRDPTVLVKVVDSSWPDQLSSWAEMVEKSMIL